MKITTQRPHAFSVWVIPLVALLFPFKTLASQDFTLVWDAVTGASHYRVEEKINGSWQVLTPQTALSITFSNRATGKYRFRVGGCVQEPGANLHCGSSVAIYSNEVEVDTSKGSGERRVIFVHTDLLGNPAAETQEKTGI
ncbi:hypothetical protein [Bowmanella denitrificans]|uniref:hypothetical protein n=1 Tax=Bowmanella denitrificans TaxID=366582 RepID=UPI0011AFB5C1|nr:hypothetical protein [Bowmanella denitrificans]